MKRKILFLVIVCLQLVNFSRAQVNYDSTLLQILYSDSTNYKKWRLPISLIWDGSVKQIGNAIKVGDTIYFMPDEWGALFRTIKSSNGIEAQRIYKTIFGGYNGQQYTFVHAGRIYSFGGYGIWRTNGQLRVFVPDKKEWEITKLNEEIPTRNEFTFYDPVLQQLWCAKQDMINEVYTSEHYVTGYKMYRLPLSTRKWEMLGEVVLPGEKRDNDAVTLAETPYGPLIFETGNTYVLYDYSKNRRIGLSKTEDSIRHYFSAKSSNLCIISINNNLLIYDTSLSKVVKIIELSSASFTVLNQPIYRKNLLHQYYFLIILVPIVALLIYLLRKRHSKSKTSTHIANKKSVETSNANFLGMLKPQELILLEYLLTLTKKGLRARTEEFNRILGTSGKSLEVQKKHRSDLIAGINATYKSFYHTDALLIINTPSSEDRRVREYHLNKDCLGLITTASESNNLGESPIGSPENEPL